MANEFKVRKGLVVNGSGSVILDIQGSQGQLFSVTDSLSGSLFSVNDISGIPVMEAFSDNTVKIGQYGAEAIIVSGSFARVTGSLQGTASYAVNALTSSFALNAANAFVQGGNSFGSVAILGTINSQNLALITNNAVRLFISSSGAYIGIGVNTPINSGPPQALLDVNGLIRARSGLQIIGNEVTTVISSSRTDNTQGGTLLFNGWGDYAFNQSLLIGYNSTTLAPVGLGSGNLFVGSKIAIGKTGSSAAFDVVGNAQITGSLTATTGITGSLFGTSSWANNATTASYALNSNLLDGFDSTQFVQTGSFGAYTSSISAFSASINSYTASINATIADILIETASINLVTASLHSYTASLNAKTSSFATTGSNTFIGNQIINGTITAQTLIVQTVSSSIEFVTGSTKFGSLATNTHQFTGSVSVSGSIAVSGSVINDLTASFAVSASRAVSSSFAQTASFALNVPVTASYALSSSQAITASFAQTASFALNVPVTASYAISASQAITSSFALTASYAANIPAAGVGASVLFTQASAANTWTFQHNLGTQYPSVNVFDSNNNLIIPTTVNATYNIITVTFGVPTSGYIVATVGGGLPTISASYANYVLQVNSTGVSASWQPFANVNVTSASYALTASYVASVANLSTFQIATGSVTASVNVNSGSFTVASGSTAFFFITSSGEVLINGSVAQNVAASRGNLTINGSTSILNLATSNTNAGYLFHGGTDMLMVNAKNGALTFATNNIERARIDASGRFGIGINFPSASLQVGNGTSNASNRSTVAILSAASSGATLDALSLINSAGATNGNGTAINFHNAGSYSPTSRIESVLDLGVNTSLRFYTYDTNLTERMRINSSGSVGIGTTSLTAHTLRISKDITGAVTTYGVHQDGIVQSDVTTVAYGFLNRSQTQATAFTLPNYRHFAAAQGTLGANSALTLQVGYYVESNLTGGTTNYGFQGLLPSSGSRNWNLYMNGTAPNYLEGSVGIGTTSLSLFGLRLSKTITGGTIAYNQFNDGAIQSDVTSEAMYYSTNATTAASSFTLTNLFHYRARYNVFNAGSTVTNQYGYFVDSTLTAASNNYGFWGALAASGSRNWNFYAAGTAPNYLAGQLLIGTTTTSSFALDVNGTARIQGIGIIGNAATNGSRSDLGLSIITNVNNSAISITSPSGTSLHVENADQTNNSYANISLRTDNSGNAVFSNVSLIKTSAGTGSLRIHQQGTQQLALFTSTGNLTLQNGGTFTDAGFRLDVSGSTRFNGNTQITGSLGVTQDITGSNARFSGTITAQTLVIQTVSSSVVYASGSNIFGNLLSNTQQFTGSVTMTGSLAVNGSNVILTNQTSSMSVLSSSFAQSASYARSASYANNLVANGTLAFNGTLADYATVGSSIVGSNNLFTRSTGSYTSVFVNYTAAKGVSARSGQLIVVWNNGTAQFTDNSTLDVGGDTGYVTMSAAIVTNQVQVNAQTNSSGWVIKSMATYM